MRIYYQHILCLPQRDHKLICSCHCTYERNPDLILRDFHVKGSMYSEVTRIKMNVRLRNKKRFTK